VSEAALVRRLVRAGVLASDDAILPDTAVERCPRRNRNTRVALSGGAGVFVKQADPRAQGSRETVIAEGAVYHAHRGGGPLSAVLPGLVHFDPSEPLLVTELLVGYGDLRSVCQAGGPAEFPIAAFRAAAAALAQVHTVTVGADGRPDGPEATPLGWVPAVRRPDPAALETLSNGAMTGLEVVQRAMAIDAGLARAADVWRSESLIHGDVRADNVMVRSHADGGIDVRLVDWELARLGDPAWDLAGLLEAAVTLALGRGETWGGDDPAAELAVPVIQATTRAVWRAYIGAGGEGSSGEGELRARATDYCAARLVQTTLELLAGADELSGSALIALQVADNVFAEPERAAAELLALW
jgi:hypothetical protein